MSATAKRIVTLGLSSLKVGDSVATGATGDTGVMPASGMAVQGNVYRDSFDFTTEDPEINEFYCEENDTPLVVQGTLGATTISFDIINPSVEDCEAWGYGTKDLTGDQQKLKSPKTWQAINKAIEITPTQGYKIEVPRASIVASMTGGGKKSEPMLLHVVATVLVPLDASQNQKDPIIYTELAAS
ncbi:MAG: hypothetical protein K6G25_06555 [Bacteroidales bacterium]|nr:hypothetical protein [Bacteroidales bacterium]